MVLLFAGFFGLMHIGNTFAAGELNSGNVTGAPYNCSTSATSCNLSYEGITSIAPNTFINHTNLQELYLYSNNITSLESGAFN
jgi:Leucine-rich repeat (LRR) protein